MKDIKNKGFFERFKIVGINQKKLIDACDNATDLKELIAILSIKEFRDNSLKIMPFILGFIMVFSVCLLIIHIIESDFNIWSIFLNLYSLILITVTVTSGIFFLKQIRKFKLMRKIVTKKALSLRHGVEYDPVDMSSSKIMNDFYEVFDEGMNINEIEEVLVKEISGKSGKKYKIALFCYHYTHEELSKSILTGNTRHRSNSKEMVIIFLIAAIFFAANRIINEIRGNKGDAAKNFYMYGGVIYDTGIEGSLRISSKKIESDLKKWKTSSIGFNKKYKVGANSEMDAARYLTPKRLKQLERAFYYYEEISYSQKNKNICFLTSKNFLDEVNEGEKPAYIPRNASLALLARNVRMPLLNGFLKNFISLAK